MIINNEKDMSWESIITGVIIPLIAGFIGGSVSLKNRASIIIVNHMQDIKNVQSIQ